MARTREKHTRKGLLFHLGNAIILLSLFGFLFIFYPIIRMYLFPPSEVLENEQDMTFSIVIPRINAYAPIVKNVDPFQETVYKTALKKGVAHASTSSLPDKEGSVFLFAHSSGYPWELTRYNTIFLRLSELEKNDAIEIFYKGRKYNYVVSEKKEVWPTEVNFLLATQEHKLILQTCTPIGTSLKRLLVFADEIHY